MTYVSAPPLAAFHWSLCWAAGSAGYVAISQARNARGCGDPSGSDCAVYARQSRRGSEQNPVPRFRVRHRDRDGARSDRDIRARASDLEHREGTDAEKHIAFRPGVARLAPISTGAQALLLPGGDEHLNSAADRPRDDMEHSQRSRLRRPVRSGAGRRSHHAKSPRRSRAAGGRFPAHPAPARSAFAVLRDAVGAHGVEASILTADGVYGQMVVSRWPFAATRSMTSAMRSASRAAPSRSRSPRPPGDSADCYAFRSVLAERRRQARRLLRSRGHMQ